MTEIQKFFTMLLVFLTAYFMPVGEERVQGAIIEAFTMLNDYAVNMCCYV